MYICFTKMTKYLNKPDLCIHTNDQVLELASNRQSCVFKNASVFQFMNFAIVMNLCHPPAKWR